MKSRRSLLSVGVEKKVNRTDLTSGGHPRKELRHRPAAGVELGDQVVGQDARHVLAQSAAGDVRHGLDASGPQQRQHGTHVDPRGRQQHLTCFCFSFLLSN